MQHVLSEHCGLSFHNRCVREISGKWTALHIAGIVFLVNENVSKRHGKLLAFQWKLCKMAKRKEQARKYQRNDVFTQLKREI